MNGKIKATGNAPRVLRQLLSDFAGGVGRCQRDIEQKAFDEITQLFQQVTAQRDELLAALKAIVSFQDEVLNEIDDDRDSMTDADFDREQSAWALARAAIAKAEKNQ